MSALLETTDVFVEGDTLYEAMHEDIARASVNIRLECYILADDAIGSPLLNALAKASRAGRRVQVRVDAFGSWRLIPPARVRALIDMSGVFNA